MQNIKWRRHEAIELCERLHKIAPMFGIHVGLTGGCLYKDHERKDCDILLYRIRQSEMSLENFFTCLEVAFKIKVTNDHGFCVKAVDATGRDIDFLIPERENGPYPCESDNPLSKPVKL